MGVEENHNTPYIKKILWCSIRMSYRCASEHWVLLSLVLLLYLLFKFSPGFFAFLLSSSPVIICATLLLAVLISHGNTNFPDINEERKATADTSAPKSDVSRNIHCDAQSKFSVPSFKENTVNLKDGKIQEACFGQLRAARHFEVDDSAPLLKGVYQENERSDAYDRHEGTLTSSHSMIRMHQKDSMEESMEANQDRESKDPFPSRDKGGVRCANLSEVVHQSRVDENQITCGLHSSSENFRHDVEMMAKENHDRGSTDSKGDEERVLSEDKPAGTCRWGRAFSVRRRKKLADIQVEAINATVDNKLDSSLGSPFGRVGIHDGSLGFDSYQAEGTSPDTLTADIPALDKIDPLLGADLSHPDPVQNDDSGNHFCLSPQDSKFDSDSNGEADNSKAKDNDEKNVVADAASICTVDDDKNVMDLGYSENERNRRLEILMAKRRSRKNIIFELDSDLIGVDNDQVCRRADGMLSFPVQVQPISEPKRNPFDIPSHPGETELPGSAPSLLHPRKNPFDRSFEQSDESDLHEPEMEMSHRGLLFGRHESFNLGSQGRRLSRFRPCFVPDAMEEPRASDFQREFSCKSASTLSAATESDTTSLVADQEYLSDSMKNDSSREYESPNVPTMGSDIRYVAGK